MAGNDLGTKYFCVVSDVGIAMTRDAIQSIYNQAQQNHREGVKESSERPMRVMMATAVGLKMVIETPYPGLVGTELQHKLSRKFRSHLTRAQQATVMQIIDDTLGPIRANAVERVEYRRLESSDPSKHHR